MKSFKLIAGALACLSLLVMSCEKEFAAGEDTTKPVVTDLRLEPGCLSDSTINLVWSAGELIAQGATSFTVEICDSKDDVVNTYDDVITTISASDITDGTGKVTFDEGISDYVEKYARIRVSYGAVFSKWTFATNDDGEPVALIANHGTRDLKKGVAQNITAVQDTDTTGKRTPTYKMTTTADLTAAESADRNRVLLIDYASQKVVEAAEISNASASYNHVFADALTDGKLYQIKYVSEYDVDGEVPHVNYAFATAEIENEEGGKDTTNIYQGGKGFVVVNGVPPSARLSKAYSGMLIFEWTESGYANVTKDRAIPVKVALYRDKECTDLVYGWTIASYSIAKQPAIVFANLEPNTTYWFTCQDTNTGLLSDAIEGKTSAFEIVQVNKNNPVAAGGTALAENFSQLYYGGEAFDYLPGPSNNNSGYTYPNVGKWDPATLNWSDGNHGFFNTLGSKKAVYNSRFRNWAVINNPTSTLNCVCIRTGMFQMGASSGIPTLFTPELTNLSGLATLKVSFVVSSMWEKGALKEASSSDFQTLQVYTATGGSTVTSTSSTSYGVLSGATLKEVGQLTRPVTTQKDKDGETDVALATPTWETKTITIKNVAAGSRIGIAAVRGKSGNQRWLLREVVVKVVSYGAPELSAPVLTSKEIGDIAATFTFEAQESAETYKLGYKKDGAKDYTYVTSSEPTFSLKDLEMETTYYIKVTAEAGGYESDPYYYEFTTTAVTPDTPVIDQTATVVKATSVNLAWNAAENALSYVVNYKKTADTEWQSVKASTNSVEIKGLKDNTSYDFKVASVRGSKQSEFSQVATFTTPEITWEYPLTISDVETFVSWMNAGAEFTTSSHEITLATDLDLTGTEIAQVATFAGTLNGNNKTIKNYPGKTALFGTVTGTIKDLTIDASCSFSGALINAAVAVTNSGTLSNVTNNAAVSYTGATITEASILGGVAAISKGAVSNCTNNGAITLNGTTSLKGVAVGGVVGKLSAAMTDCINTGKISVETPLVAGSLSVDGVTAVPCVGGLVGLGGSGFSMTSCDNKGEIAYKETGFDKGATLGSYRVSIGGIAGGPNGDIAKCNNYGTLNLKVTATTGAASGINHNLVAGGISGSDIYATNQSKTNITDCVNEGALNIENWATGSNSAYGGIVGWPGKEAAGSITTKRSGCTNKGAITVSGEGKHRVGGIQGGVGPMDNCINEGKITVNAANSASVVGGLCGFNHYNYDITNCKSLGDVAVNCTVAGIGGVFGQHGNAASTECTEGVIVNCALSGGTAANTGLVIGVFNGSAAITLGSEASPIKVSGSVNGTAITAENYSDYLHGTTKFSASAHTIHAAFGE